MPGRELLGLATARVEEAERERAPDAGHAVRRDRADRIVDPDRSTSSTPSTTITPATKPITIAAHGATNAHAAVIATSAAIAPFSIIERSGFLITSHDGDDGAEDAGRGREVRVQRDVGEEADAAEVDARASSPG